MLEKLHSMTIEYLGGRWTNQKNGSNELNRYYAYLQAHVASEMNQGDYTLKQVRMWESYIKDLEAGKKFSKKRPSDF